MCFGNRSSSVEKGWEQSAVVVDHDFVFKKIVFHTHTHCGHLGKPDETIVKLLGDQTDRWTVGETED